MRRIRYLCDMAPAPATFKRIAPSFRLATPPKLRQESATFPAARPHTRTNDAMPAAPIPPPDSETYDLAIVGGGVNGVGIARDAAGRGLRTVLFEQGDLGQATSSASTKLIHGGLRYLERYEFRLVREALIERERLLDAMPHIARPLRFVLPHHAGLRPAWLLRFGLFVYDHLGGRRRLPPTRTLDLRTDTAGTPLLADYIRGFEYSDGWVDDARLVVLNARDAARRGAEIRVRTRFLAAARTDGLWRIETEDAASGGRATLHARALVNAAGPWVDGVVGRTGGAEEPPKTVRLVRGSHIVLPRMFAHDHAYILQNADGRIVFAIPYDDDFTLIGTTDVDHDGPPERAVCEDAEADYLIAAVNGYFRRKIARQDIVWRYAGVRALHADPSGAASKASRDYALEARDAAGAAPILSVFGGKITTYRRLAEAALARLRPWFSDLGPDWTAGAPLPGGDFRAEDTPALIARLRADYPFLDDRQARRLLRAYGLDAFPLLGDARTDADLGVAFGAGLTEREVAWLMAEEWARTAEDVLWRRSKLGLRVSAADAARLEAFMENADGRARKMRETERTKGVDAKP